MHDLDALPSTDPGRLGFERDWDDLADVGVRLPKAQRWLWEEVVGLGEEILCITPHYLEDTTGYRMRKEPINFWDVAENDEKKVWYPRLVLVRNDPAWWDKVAEFHAVQRFPTLLGLAEEDGYGYGFSGEEYPEPFRIWDLWPVSGMDADAIRDVLQTFHEENDLWRTTDAFLTADRGDMDLCDFAEYEGGGAQEEHVHLDHMGGVVSWEDQNERDYYDCATGRDMLEQLSEEVTVEVDGTTYLRYPGDVEVPPSLVDAWTGLLDSSRRNSSAAILAFPPWERDEVLIIERAYNQWLWSY